MCTWEFRERAACAAGDTKGVVPKWAPRRSLQAAMVCCRLSAWSAADCSRAYAARKAVLMRDSSGMQTCDAVCAQLLRFNQSRPFFSAVSYDCRLLSLHSW